MAGAYKTSSPLLSLPSAANGVTVTPSGIANGWSSWVQLTASAATDMRLATILALPGTRAVGNYYEVEIGTGGSGSETPVAAVRGYSGYNGGGPADYSDVLTLGIPADVITTGQRVSCRLRQTSTDTTAWRVSIQYWATPVTGVMPASSIGPVNVPSGSAFGPITGAAGAYGAWTEVSASTDGSWTITNVTCVGPNGGFWEVQFGLGGAGSEEPIWSVRSYAKWFNTADAFQGGPWNILLRPTLGPIPSGSRLAIRVRSASGVFALGIGLTVLKEAVTGAASMLRMLWSDWTTIASAAGGLASFTPWTTMIAAAETDIAITGLSKTFAQAGQAGISYIQLAAGAAGEEVVFADCYALNGVWGGGRFNFPLPYAFLLNTGTRVSLRYSSAYLPSGVPASFTLSYQEILTEPDFDNWSNGLIQGVYLDSSPTNTPFALVAGSPAWANGSWTEIDASVPVDRVLTAYMTSNPAQVEYELDFGVGSVGNEVAFSTLRMASGCDQSGGAVMHDVLPIPAILGSGERFAIRARASSQNITINVAPHYTAEPVTPAPTPPPELPGTTTFQIRRLRRTPTIFSDGNRIFHQRLQIECEPGIGTVDVPSPTMLIRFSDDGGLTWSDTREATPGGTGDYQDLIRLYGMGSAYNRSYEVVVSDPAPWALIQAFIDLEGGTH